MTQSLRMAWIIARREFAAYFATPLAGVFAAGNPCRVIRPIA